MKEGILSYLKKIKTLYIILMVILTAGTLFCLPFATMLYLGYVIIAVVLIALIIVLKIVYSNKVSLGTVFEIRTNGDTLILRTSKQDFMYNLTNGCKKVKVRANKFICTFESGGFEDSFIFYKRAPFSKSDDIQFTSDDIRIFYPDFKVTRSRD